MAALIVPVLRVSRSVVMVPLLLVSTLVPNKAYTFFGDRQLVRNAYNLSASVAASLSQCLTVEGVVLETVMPMLHIQLLGDFRLLDGDTPIVAIHQARQQSLLAYLLLHRGVSQSRQRLAFLFWPDTSEAQAQTNLRQLLHHLRRAWPASDDYLLVEPRAIAWKSAIPYHVDIADFEEAIAAATTALQTEQVNVARAVCAKAVDLYSGDLLPACYEEWLLSERERLRQSFLDTLERLVVLCEDERDYASAIRYAQRLLRADPLHETTYRRLMRLYALNGDRAGALRIYHICATTLRRELGVEPNQDTQEAYTSLLNMEAPQVLQTRPVKHPVAGDRLVGRQIEWTRLHQAWETTKRGRTHLVCIVGEAGIGKTRLTEELIDWARQQGIGHARAHAYAAAGCLAYAPVAEWLRTDAFEIARKGLPDIWRSEVTRLLPELLAQLPALPPPEPLTERWQLQRFFEALARAVMMANQPFLLTLDDLQWCDLETLEWLPYLLRFNPTARLLIVVTLRPEEIDEQHPVASFLLDLRADDQLTEIELGPLTPEETASLAAQMAMQPVTADAALRLYQETEGNPLFIVETMRSEIIDGVINTQTTDANVPFVLGSPFPPRVYSVILRRLAQLSPAGRDLAGLAAVIGRSFTFDLLSHSSGLTEDVLVAALDELWLRRLMRVQSDDSYDFSHGRIREVAYAQLSPMRRRLLHLRVAQALERLYQDDLDSVAGEFAAHSEHAGLHEQAARYYARAAETAHRLLAYAEMATFLQKSLSQLDSLPATSENLERRLDALSRLGSALLIVKGLTAPEVEATLSRAREVCGMVDDANRRFEVLHALRYYWGQRCRWSESSQLNDELLLLGYRTEEPVHLQAALRLTGASAFHQGRLQEAFRYFEQAVSLFEVDQQRNHNQDHEQDQGIANLRRIVPTLWLCGYPDQAQARLSELLARTREIARPFDMLMTLDFAFDLAHFLRHSQAAQEYAAEYSVLTAKHRYPHCVAVEKTFHGWVLVEQGDVDEGIALIKQGIDRLREMGTLLFSSQGLALLVEALVRAGRFAQGVALVDEALTFLAELGECYWNAEFYRHKGDMLLALGSNAADVEHCYRQALATAREQGARSLELRAAVSLARLWQLQGNHADAYLLLAEIYAWFTEGFDTPDLQEAGALLAELKRNA